MRGLRRFAPAVPRPHRAHTIRHSLPGDRNRSRTRIFSISNQSVPLDSPAIARARTHRTATVATARGSTGIHPLAVVAGRCNWSGRMCTTSCANSGAFRSSRNWATRSHCTLLDSRTSMLWHHASLLAIIDPPDREPCRCTACPLEARRLSPCSRNDVVCHFFTVQYSIGTC
jgi:hypothetical protein